MNVRGKWNVLGKRVFGMARVACAAHGKSDDDTIADVIALAYERHANMKKELAVSSMIHLAARTICLNEAIKRCPESVTNEELDLLAADYDDGRASPDLSRLKRCTDNMPATTAATAEAIGISESVLDAAHYLELTKRCVAQRVRRMRNLPCVTDLAIRHYGPVRALAVFVA